MDKQRKPLVIAAWAFAGYALYAWFATRRFESLVPETAHPPGAFVDLNGLRVHYIQAGEGDPVVLIHGWNGSTFSFRYAIPELARHYRVVALDLKGYGYSDRPASGDYSLTAQSELVAALMSRLGIARAAVIGHSMGGSVAMRLALGHPERVSRLALVSSVSGELRPALRLGKLVGPLLPLGAPLSLHRQGFRRRAFRSAVHDPALVTPDTLEAYFRPMRMRGHLRSLGAQLGGRARDAAIPYERILQPTLILWGEQDRWLPPSRGEQLASRLPNAELRWVPSAGHLPLEEQPDVCNRLLLEFLEAPKESEEPGRADGTPHPLSLAPGATA
ncbi:MAG: alpha/beta fold hydrolase [Dehalococcoidia bacterium]